MNYLSKITSLATVCVLMFCLQSARGQSDIDTNRMQRDINIMENVLQEMFKTQWVTRGDAIHVRSGRFSSGGNRVRGTYLPGYGLIFTIQRGFLGIVSMPADLANKRKFMFQYGGAENGTEVTQKSITEKIAEFLQDYGSTIGQLSDDEKVMVIYDSRNTNPEVMVFRSGDNSDSNQQSIPTISVVAQKADLQAYRSGELSEEQFRNRLQISTAEANDRSQKDLKVMAGIFESGFEDSDEESFRIMGSVDYLNLENFGALFSFNARYGQRHKWDFTALDEQLNKVRRNTKTLDDSVNINKIEIKKTLDAENLGNRKATKEKTLKAYEVFVEDLKEYLIDYGRTLRSVESGQRVLVSVTLRTRYEEIPERLDLQIEKSVLTSLDQGGINREEAINQIQVREY